MSTQSEHTEDLAPLTEFAAATRDAIAAVSEGIGQLREEIRALRPTKDEAAGAPEPERNAALLPGGPGAADMQLDPIEARWWRHDRPADENRRRVRANLELAGMLLAGARANGVPVEQSDAFNRVWRAYLFERMPAPHVVAESVVDVTSRAPRTRAMDTQETGYGAELVGAQYITSLWEAARRADGLLEAIPAVQMTAPTAYIPVDGALPEMLLVSESTDSADTKYPDSKAGTGRRQLTARKFTIQVRWSAELAEDSVVGFVDMLREKLAASYALHLASAIYNGDQTNAGTGNINSDDAAPADTRHYLAFDGIRHYWLVDDAGNGVNGGGAAITAAMIYQARARLFGAGNSVNALDSIDWGTDPGNLRIVANPGLYNRLLQLPEVQTVDKLGPAATIATGQLAAIGGIPIIVPAYAPKTEADGKLSATPANNTLGQLSVVNPRGWVRGSYRGFQLFLSRIQGRDQFLVEVYSREALARWGNDVAAGVYNVVSD